MRGPEHKRPTWSDTGSVGLIQALWPFPFSVGCGSIESGTRQEEVVVDLVTTGVVVFVAAILLLIISVTRRPHY